MGICGNILYSIVMGEKRVKILGDILCSILMEWEQGENTGML